MGARVRPGCVGNTVERAAERFDGGEIEIGIAPLQHAERIEIVVFERLDQLLIERRAAACVPYVPSRVLRPARPAI